MQSLECRTAAYSMVACAAAKNCCDYAQLVRTCEKVVFKRKKDVLVFQHYYSTINPELYGASGAQISRSCLSRVLKLWLQSNENEMRK